MATTTAVPANGDTLITIKVAIDGTNRRFKLPLRDLGARVFPEKLRSVLSIAANEAVIFERFSDSSASYVVLDADNHAAYKQLYRAAKAKLKLRIKATVIRQEPSKDLSAEEMLPLSLPPLPSSPLDTTQAKAPETDPSTSNTSDTNLPKMSQIPIRNAYSSCRKMNRAAWWDELHKISRAREQGRRMKEPPAPLPTASAWLVYCNNCEAAMPDAHYHCSICDNGDYDLCETCVNSGVLCPGQTHWLIKRFVQNGQVVNSITEKIPPKPKPEIEKPKALPGAFTEDLKTDYIEPSPVRTCNSCVKVFPEKNLINCVDCKDYDICMPCHIKNDHGHNPGHTFRTVEVGASVSGYATLLLEPGRHVRHPAICDGCDQTIYGVRHKCLDCPDWDFCGNCYATARTSHTGHRFVPIYKPLSMPINRGIRHAVYCDGPLCLGKNNNDRYIEGVRYKCAVCHDTDFCAGCEAHPSNKHNPTHPLIMFKTPVRNVSVTTVGEDKHGEPLAKMGDKFPWPTAATATGMQTQATITSQPPPPPPYMDKQEVASSKSLADYGFKSEQTKKIESKVNEKNFETMLGPKLPDSSKLDAHFLRDAVPDGTKFLPGTRFEQTWLLTNPGPHIWPVGCSVCYIGGDANIASKAQTVSNTTQYPVEAGQPYHFTIYMHAPEREGKHISYWRLKAPDGTPFGHKLWCDIDVATPNEPPKHAEALLRTLKEELAHTMKHVKIEEPTVEEKPTDLSSSEMVFPVLEKESPSSSTYQDAPATMPPTTVTEAHPALSTSPNTTKSISYPPTDTTETAVGDTFETVEHPEVASDVDSMTAADDLDDDSDEAFLTDEEYDILDASDEEIINGGK